jgi:hypothetical protein
MFNLYFLRKSGGFSIFLSGWIVVCLVWNFYTFIVKMGQKDYGALPQILVPSFLAFFILYFENNLESYKKLFLNSFFKYSYLLVILVYYFFPLLWYFTTWGQVRFFDNFASKKDGYFIFFLHIVIFHSATILFSLSQLDKFRDFAKTNSGFKSNN